MGMNTIYLVGQISPKFPVTYDWRTQIEVYFENHDDIKIINPCANSFNKELVKENRYAVGIDGREMGIDVLPSKDLKFVMDSDVAIVNLNQYDKDKELLGSYFEMAWYYLYQEKTVIAFADDLNSYNCRHPFVKMAVDVFCNNAEEACYIVDKYFVGN